jgi:hypothetical protein
MGGGGRTGPLAPARSGPTPALDPAAAEVRRLYRVRPQIEEVIRVCKDQLGLTGGQALSERPSPSSRPPTEGQGQAEACLGKALRHHRAQSLLPSGRWGSQARRPAPARRLTEAHPPGCRQECDGHRAAKRRDTAADLHQPAWSTRPLGILRRSQGIEEPPVEGLSVALKHSACKFYEHPRASDDHERYQQHLE